MCVCVFVRANQWAIERACVRVYGCKDSRINILYMCCKCVCHMGDLALNALLLMSYYYFASCCFFPFENFHFLVVAVRPAFDIFWSVCVCVFFRSLIHLNILAVSGFTLTPFYFFEFSFHLSNANEKAFTDKQWLLKMKCGLCKNVYLISI